MRTRLLDEFVIEIWKPVISHPGYEVSSLGRVRSVSRFIKGRWGPYWKEGRILRQISGRYLTTKLRSTHIVALTTFKGPRPLNHQASHLDGNAHNNRIYNLEWETPSQNMSRKAAHGSNVGPTHYRTKFDNATVRSIFLRVESGEPVRAIATEYDVNYYTIWSIHKGRNWKHIRREFYEDRARNAGSNPKKAKPRLSG